MSDDRERWLSDGKCSQCRRRPHCTTKCKANKEKIRELAREQMLSRFMKRD